MTLVPDLAPAPDPQRGEWVVFKHLPRYGWKLVEVCGEVIARSADESSVLVMYWSPMCWRQTTKWVERTKILQVLVRADEAALATSST